MAPVAERLAELLGAEVELAPARRRRRGRRAAPRRLGTGEVLLLENTRFEPGETKNDAELAARPRRARRPLRQRRLRRRPPRPRLDRGRRPAACPPTPACCSSASCDELTSVLEDPKRPLVVVLGGAKVTDKIGVIDRFLELADAILIGGAMCFSFFRAQGHETGNSLVEDEGIELAREALERAESSDCDLRPADRPRARRELLRRRRGRSSSTASTCPRA